MRRRSPTPPTGSSSPTSTSLRSAAELFQTNLIMPEPTAFLNRKFPVCSIIRPTETKGAAMGAATFLTKMGLFRGQPPAFFTALTTLARQADAAHP